MKRLFMLSLALNPDILVLKDFKVKPLSDMKNQEGIKIKELKDNLKIIRKWMLIRRWGINFH